MNFFVENNGGSREFMPVPPGNHLARCYRIIDLGTQKSEYQGQVKFLRKVMINWEVHGENDAGEPLVTERGEPLSIFKNYTLSWGENATLRKDMQAWRGKPWSDEEAKRFDLKQILGVWGMLNVIQRPGTNGKIYSNVQSISPVPPIIRKQGLPEGANELQLFMLSQPDWELYETFGRGLKAKIESSPEYRAIATPEVKEAYAEDSEDVADMRDDIPF